jgi:hypothetical protein
MQADVAVYAHLVKQCRMLRMSEDVDKARAALDAEQELVRILGKRGLQLPDGALPVVRRRNRRSAVTAAVVAGGAA